MEKYIPEIIASRWDIIKWWMFDHTPYFIFICYHKIRDVLREIKWAYQRVVHGYDDRIYWSLDEYCARLFPKVFYYLRDESWGVPFNLTEQQWNKVLTEMAEGFETFISLQEGKGVDTMGPNEYKKFYNKEWKKVDKALTLFKKYFGHLWS